MVELDQDEARAVAARFGVAIEQVRRDHLLSQVLAAISNAHADRVIFFGGTALARTYLPEGRLSEDVDLIAVGSRAETAAAIEKTLRSALRRSHGRIAWAPALTAIRDTDAAVLVADDGQLSVRIQLLDRLGYELWPTSTQAIEQRYRDAPAASLRVPIGGGVRGVEDRGMARSRSSPGGQRWPHSAGDLDRRRRGARASARSSV